MANTNFDYMGFNLNPEPTGGNGAYGKVPGSIGAPPSIYQQIEQLYPGISKLTEGAGSAINNELSGVLSPETQSNIGNYAASRGVELGQPNSPLSNLIGMNITGTTTEGLKRSGIADYSGFLGSLGSTQLNPALLSEIATQNSVWRSAPDPASAAAAQLALFDRYSNPAGGTGARSTSFSGRTTGLGYGGSGTGIYSGGGVAAPGQGGGYSGSPYSFFNMGGTYGGGYGTDPLESFGGTSTGTNWGGASLGEDYTNYSGLGMDFPAGYWE